jgi:hypothetical protein
MKPHFLNGLAFGVLQVALAACQVVYGQSAPVRGSLTVPVNDGTVVTFFYLPANSYLHPALIFRVAKPGSPLLNKAPIKNRGGRTPYISIEEMRDLVGLLDHSDLSWRKSKQMEVPGAPSFSQTTGKLEIKVIGSDGTTLSLSNPDDLCQTLAPLDAALKQPRARWEFQLFRVQYHCQVPGFDRNAYPEHDEGAK